MAPRPKKKHRHDWWIDIDTKAAGDFSWCKCGVLRWRCVNGGHWRYVEPEWRSHA